MFIKYFFHELWIDIKIFSLFFFASMIAPIRFRAPKWCCVRRPEKCRIWNCKYHWDDSKHYNICSFRNHQ